MTTNGVRACGRPASSESSCKGTLYSAINEYQRVCGRVIGYQYGTVDSEALPKTREAHGVGQYYITR